VATKNSEHLAKDIKLRKSVSVRDSGLLTAVLLKVQVFWEDTVRPLINSLQQTIRQ
jgi:hypothetical protein